MAAAILLFCFQGAGRALKRSGDLVQRERKNKALRGSVHQVRAGRAPKRPGDLVQRERKNRALRGSVHQVRAGRAPKRSGDLVQMERKNKVLRGFVHQVRAGRALKRSGDLVQMERKNKGLRGFVHQVGTGRASTPGRKIGKGGPAPPKLAPHCRQNLVSPLRGANILPWSAAGHRPSWRLGAGKTLCLRYEAPTFCSGAQPVTAQVGAPLPAKPYASVTGRQHLALAQQPAAKTIKKRATSVARPWCAIRGSNPGHPD